PRPGPRRSADEGAAQAHRPRHGARRSQRRESRLHHRQRQGTHEPREARRAVRQRLRAQRRTTRGHAPRQRTARLPRGRTNGEGEERVMTEAEVAAASAKGTKDKDGAPYRAMEGTLIKCRGVKKTYYRGEEAVQVLDGLDLDIPEGSFEALMGPSGSG